MRVKLKLNKSELPALTEVLEKLIIKNEALTELHEIVCALLIIKLYKKLKEKCAVIDKKKYSIGVETETQLSFIFFFQKEKIPVATYHGQLTHRVLTEFYSSTSNLTT